MAFIEPPVNVEANLELTSITEVDDRLNRIKLSLKMKIGWYDPRLELEDNVDIVEKADDFEKCIWTPRLWFYGQQSIRKLDRVLRSTSLTLTRSSQGIGVKNKLIEKTREIAKSLFRLK